MSKWANATPKERQSAPADTFCGPGRSFPVADEEDFNKAVHALGRAGGSTGPIKACLIGKARANGWTLPDTWKANNSAFALTGLPPTPSGQNVHVAAFSGDGLTKYGTVRLADGDDYVVRRGKVFAVGEYADKQFSASPEDLVLASLDFMPVANRVQHIDPAETPTFFDGHLGELRALSLADDGETLIGEVAIPTWFDTFMREKHPDKPFSVSLEFDRVTKRVVGNTIVPNPRIADSDLIGGFAEFAGARGIQTMHDMAVAHGAKCGASASMAMRNADVVQRFHDVAVAHGATCIPQSAMNDPDNDAGDSARMSLTNMRVGDFFRALFTGKDPIATNGGTVAPTRAEEQPEMTDTISKAQFDAMETRVKAAEATAAALEAERRRERAVVFADRMVTEHRIFPSMREALIRLHVTAAEDDAAAPKTVTFAKGEQDITGNRVEQLMAAFSVTLPHNLTEELLKDGTLVELANRAKTAKAGEPKKPDAKRIDDLMAMTPTGKQILRERANGK